MCKKVMLFSVVAAGIRPGIVSGFPSFRGYFNCQTVDSPSVDVHPSPALIPFVATIMSRGRLHKVLQ